MDQRVTGQKAKAHMEINEISARAFGQFYRHGETTGILRWDVIDNEIQLEAINISTELAIKNKKNNWDQDSRDTVPQEYHHLLDVFEKGEKSDITTPPTRDRPWNRLERRKNGAHKKGIRPDLRPTRRAPSIHQTERGSRVDSKGEVRKGITNHVCQEKGRQTWTIRRLLITQRSHQKRSTSTTTH